MQINFWAILVCAILAMIIGALWYGPLFGGTWARVVKADALDTENRKKMQKAAFPLYVVQFLLTLFQLFVLAHLTGSSARGGIFSALWVWAGFIVPMIAATAIWNNDSRNISWARFLIQSGYQLVCFAIFGLVLGSWVLL